MLDLFTQVTLGGEYLGSIDGVNHTEIIGHKFTQTRPTDLLTFIGGQEPFNQRKLFVDHASKLATEVERPQSALAPPQYSNQVQYTVQDQYYPGQSQYYNIQGQSQNYTSQSYLPGAMLSPTGY